MSEIIYKAAAVIIQNNKLLIVKHRNIEQWISPGGKVEENETYLEALDREIKEELGVEVTLAKFYFTTLPELAAGDKLNRQLVMQVFFTEISGKPQPNNEIVEIHFLSKQEYLAEKYDLASGLQMQIIPKLINEQLLL